MLFMFCSVLSPGDEYGVLEDMLVAVSELKNVKFQVCDMSQVLIGANLHNPCDVSVLR